jgi:hypothetical protein
MERHRRSANKRLVRLENRTRLALDPQLAGIELRLHCSELGLGLQLENSMKNLSIFFTHHALGGSLCIAFVYISVNCAVIIQFQTLRISAG